MLYSGLYLVLWKRHFNAATCVFSKWKWISITIAYLPPTSWNQCVLWMWQKLLMILRLSPGKIFLLFRRKGSKNMKNGLEQAFEYLITARKNGNDHWIWSYYRFKNKTINSQLYRTTFKIALKSAQTPAQAFSWTAPKGRRSGPDPTVQDIWTN